MDKLAIKAAGEILTFVSDAQKASIVDGQVDHELLAKTVIGIQKKYLHQVRNEAIEAMCPACRGEKLESHKTGVFKYADDNLYYHLGKEPKYPKYHCRATKIREKLMEAK
ncbi:hypothetical protein KAR91_27475 [Candidatus Pacearchaeota archaeon]|nr:hypothetical protein [Candidatus Pacearchaeota archaeon]